MEEEKSLTVCDHFSGLEKEKLEKLLDNWATGDVCVFKHIMEKEPSNAKLLISLSGYFLGCARSTDTKCLAKAFDEDKKYCLTLNPTDGSIW